jgi:hypothetical protein
MHALSFLRPPTCARPRFAKEKIFSKYLKEVLGVLDKPIIAIDYGLQAAKRRIESHVLTCD